ncbi:ATP-binding protein [Neptunicoccus cionae]|uniref:ATP-binding protein n=1 Tax=Neptunicoccus cionae TaxID=2035344 RepID=UPI00166F522A|nr:ATP-binding protein [Amylibacter cionae]
MIHTRASAADQLLYKITHDLSETVRALVELPKWICEDLADAHTNVSADVQENLDALIVNGTRLETLISGLQTYSRVGLHQILSVVDLPTKMAEFRQSITLPTTVELTTTCNTNSIQVYEPDFSNLCLALLDNAVKHRDNHTSSLRLSIISSDHLVEIEMEDNGPGISKELRSKATHVLTTLRSKDEVEGNGIGLALAQKVTDSYRGSLYLETAFPKINRGLRVRALLNDPAIGWGNKVKNNAFGLINS